jgi:glycosyltransferase involved in cell wall biosynthesis
MRRRISHNYSTTAYIVARETRRCLRTIKHKLLEKGADTKLITLEPEQPSRGKVLFSYIINGFLLKPGKPVPINHTNIWQSLRMAETFVELGYTVDVISWKNDTFIPKGDYSAFVDVRRNLERITPLLNRDCVKIAHLDTAHILFHNAAEARRLLELQERRGIILTPHRFELPNLAIEHADVATTGGNDFTVNTFKYANKPIYKLPSPCAITYDWINGKNWDACRKRFLWFSSSGLVHKGLDLVLDTFLRLPDCHLTVCAPLERETDFLRVYHKELYETPNITAIGWVDLRSQQFKDITASCAAAIHISCSEGGAPAVKNCMHAGLIPVASYESAVDVEDFGFILNNCAVDNIEKTIRYITSLPRSELEARSRRAWEFARRYHTRENFAKIYRRVISEILPVGDISQSHRRQR